ncbi:MAG: uroporphyrinogen decarboxylase family protein [Kiritimatiellae bacterium]|nr:uroporphyrinogen decarboxylase family protein [Kiritimatiellia bacterium]
MKVFPETFQRQKYYYLAYQGKAEAVPILAQINEHVAKLYGGDIREYYTDAKKMVEMNLAVHQYYALDLPGFYYDQYNIEAEALGQRINWEPERMPDIDREHFLIREHSDLERVRPPDFKKTARMPFVLEVMNRCYDLGLVARIRFCSPFSLAVNIRGIEPLLMDILTAPQFVHRLLTFLTDEVVIPWIQAQREAIGQPRATASGADASASIPIVNVPILEEFVIPYVARMNEKIGPVISQGNWGLSYLYGQPKLFRRMLELMAKMSPNLLLCADPDVAATGPGPYVEFAREQKIPLMLGIGSHLLQEGPIEKIAECCRKYVEVGEMVDRRLILYFNDISVCTPPDHVHAAIAAARHFGKYPIRKLALQSFRPAKSESFQSFRERFS